MAERTVYKPMDMDFGRGAVVADPHGAAFGMAAANPVRPATG